MELLDGNWKLVYTSNSELMALLALSRLPFVSIDDITQQVDSRSGSVENKMTVTVPFSRTSFSTTASIEVRKGGLISTRLLAACEPTNRTPHLCALSVLCACAQVRSPQRLQLMFERGTVSTPQLMSDLELPDSVSVMGQVVDLSALKAALGPVRSSASSIFSQVANLVQQQPDLSIPIAADRAQTWLLTTYLDDDTRISRGDGSSIFVLVKEVGSRAQELQRQHSCRLLPQRG